MRLGLVDRKGAVGTEDIVNFSRCRPGFAAEYEYEGVVQNLFMVGRHLQRATTYRLLRDRSFKEWSAATAA